MPQPRASHGELVVKHSPTDFLVRENLVVDFVPRDSAAHEYVLLRKLGYTTFEAIRVVAAELDVAPKEVTYAGLKDEDGITEQLIAVPVTHRELGHRAVVHGPDRWLELHHYGYGTKPLTIGRLNGNGFRTIVRNLDDERAARLSEAGKLTTFFLNYYDTQRFGVPNGKKLTHGVGEAILGDDWDTALRRLGELGAPESEQAQAWTGTGQEFFRRLDPRVTSFYCAADASFRWNTELREVVLETCAEESYSVNLEGLRYVYVTSAEAAVGVLRQARELPHTKYTFVDDVMLAAISQRTTVVQTIVTVGEIAPDEFFPGRSRVTLSFFLPSGCYATAAMRQLLGYLR